MTVLLIITNMLLTAVMAIPAGFGLACGYAAGKQFLGWAKGKLFPNKAIQQLMADYATM